MEPQKKDELMTELEAKLLALGPGLAWQAAQEVTGCLRLVHEGLSSSGRTAQLMGRLLWLLGPGGELEGNKVAEATECLQMARRIDAINMLTALDAPTTTEQE